MAQCTARDQGMHVEMGLQQLVPGMQDHDGTELATQATLAKVE
jgi:hypothetical protein